MLLEVESGEKYPAIFITTEEDTRESYRLMGPTGVERAVKNWLKRAVEVPDEIAQALLDARAAEAKALAALEAYLDQYYPDYPVRWD